MQVTDGQIKIYDEWRKQQLDEYLEWKRRVTRFDNEDTFLEFCSRNFVYYPPDFGHYIQTLITTDDQLIEFAQRVSIDDTDPSNTWMWFQREDDNHLFDFDETDSDVIPTPTELVRSYVVDYNPYDDQVLGVIEDIPSHYKKKFAPGKITVKPEIRQKMPFIASFISHDTFDRYGSIKGNRFEIIPLANVKENVITFI